MFILFKLINKTIDSITGNSIEQLYISLYDCWILFNAEYKSVVRFLLTRHYFKV